MALPVAPLGQLSNLNMPYSIPRYEKPQGALEKALTAFLVGVAGQAGSQIVENAMSRDYGSELGREDAGFFSRMLSGPEANRQEWQDQQNFQQAQELEETRFQNQSDLEYLEAMNANERLGRAQEHDYDMAGLSARNTVERDRQLNEAERQRMLEIERIRQENALTQSQLDEATAIRLAQLRAALEARSPQGQYYQSQADNQQIFNARLRGLGNNPTALPGTQGGLTITQVPTTEEDLQVINQILATGQVPPETPPDVMEGLKKLLHILSLGQNFDYLTE